jgi:16S rRNA U516 pseudouridylate synthase RsuA-like enzyme
MVRKVGNRVVKLKRIRVASILLGQLEKGRWRYLSETEVKSLHELIKD